MLHIGHLTAESADQEEEIKDVSGELHEHERWEPDKIHYDYYSREPLDEDLYQKGRDDELRAMQDYGVYVEIPIREAAGGKHIRGFTIAQMKGDRVRWRFGFRGEHRVTGGQSSGHATVDDHASNRQSCRFMSQFRWSSHENESFLGCQESVLQC